ncbi:MAG: hypothetical protein Q4F72_06820, partial [Desulfovibrionaceae bacterium]|nr:hypothetical protein [Desulfovibrionaceae bacterium]
YEPPEDHESYIHRSGRTGRANAAGTVISLVDIMEHMELERIARHYNLHLHEIADPTDEEVARVVSSRLLTLMEARYRKLNALEKTRVRRYTAFARELANLQLEDESEGAGVNLLGMLLDACHHNTLDDMRLPKPPAPRKEREKRRDSAAGRRGGERAVEDAEADAELQDGSLPDEDGQSRSSRRRRKRRKRGGHRSGENPAVQSQSAEGAETESELSDAAAAPAEGSAENAGASDDAGTPAPADEQPKKKSRKRRRRRKSSSAEQAPDSASDESGSDDAGELPGSAGDNPDIVPF